jgi:hypothetical protein
MIIKKTSLIVAIVSGYVIAMVLILTLVGYVAYVELRKENFIRSYDYKLQKLNARNYGKFISFTKLNTRIESGGALKGHPVIEGIIQNSGNRGIADMLARVKFLDKDGAVIYELIFHPQEPSLGSSTLSQVSIPYLVPPPGVTIEPNSSLAFKKILNNCPGEILGELKTSSGNVKGLARRTGSFQVEPISLKFQEL